MLESRVVDQKPSFVLNRGSTIPRQKAFPHMIIVIVPFYKMWIHDPQHQGTFWLPAQRSRLSRRDLGHKSCASCQTHKELHVPWRTGTCRAKKPRFSLESSSLRAAGPSYSPHLPLEELRAEKTECSRNPRKLHQSCTGAERFFF